MNVRENKPPFVAIACGGTGGHLFPGIAVAEQLKKRGCRIGLLISPKEVDQQAVRSAHGMEVFTLPAVGLQKRNYYSFAFSFWKALRAARQIFKGRPPQAVLAMGGFTSAPPIFAAGRGGAKKFLHESNTIPGRANRLLARFVDEAFVGFPETTGLIEARKTSVTGTPVRPGFLAPNVPPAAFCRATLGLEPDLPTILVVGGSQGANGVNEMIAAVLPLLASKNWQWLHLTGANDFDRIKAAYAGCKLKAVVKPFLSEIAMAMGAATIAVSRAGASSLAEIAALRLPSLLVPFPAAAENHQYFNAIAFEKTGAAKILEQKSATPERVAAIVRELMDDETGRIKMQAALARWHTPEAAERIAEAILTTVAGRSLPEFRKSDTNYGHSRIDSKILVRQLMAFSKPMCLSCEGERI